MGTAPVPPKTAKSGREPESAQTRNLCTFVCKRDAYFGPFWAVETKNGSRKGIALYYTGGFQLREARKELPERQYRAAPHTFSCLDLCLEVREISSGVECATSPGEGSG